MSESGFIDWSRCVFEHSSPGPLSQLKREGFNGVRKREQNHMNSRIFGRATSVIIGVGVSVFALGCGDQGSGEGAVDAQINELARVDQGGAGSTPVVLGRSESGGGAASREQAGGSLDALRSSKDGCYETDPVTQARTKVPCSALANRPYPPRRSRVGRQDAESVGNGNTILASTSSNITTALGTFPTVTNVTSESSNGASNAFTLQINTNFFNTAECQGRAGCQGWQQFIFEKTAAGQKIYMQGWLINFGVDGVDNCPAAWPNRYVIGTQLYCWSNSPGSTAIPDALSITDLGSMQLLANANSSGQDLVQLRSAVGTYNYHTGSMMGLSGATWNTVEFNIVGDCCSREATFNNGATIGLRLDLGTVDHSVASPICAPPPYAGGTTGETNNLNLVPASCCPISGVLTNGLPAITYLETNAAGVQAPYCLLREMMSFL